MTPTPEAGPPARVPLLGVPLALTDYAGAVAYLLSWARRRDGARLVAAANTHVLSLARRDASFRAALDGFDLIVPDGMPLVWCLNRFARAGLTDRVYGPELTLRLLAASQGQEFRHYFLGGSDAVRERLLTVLGERFPALQVVGSHSPPFGTWDDAIHADLVGRIWAARPDFVWVGLGCPKQERLLAAWQPRLPPAVYLAVGAAFPLISGEVRQAPPGLQRLGLEWAFRLGRPPRRLGRRYLVHNTLFLWYVLQERWGSAAKRTTRVAPASRR